MSQDLGHRVQELRQQAGLSQEELAARVAVSRATIQNVERGRGVPRPATMRRIAEALGTDVTGLTSDDSPQEPTLDELRAARRKLIDALRMDDPERKQELLADALALIGRAMEHGRYDETG